METILSGNILNCIPNQPLQYRKCNFSLKRRANSGKIKMCTEYLHTFLQATFIIFLLL